MIQYVTKTCEICKKPFTCQSRVSKRRYRCNDCSHNQRTRSDVDDDFISEYEITQVLQKVKAGLLQYMQLGQLPLG